MPSSWPIISAIHSLIAVPLAFIFLFAHVCVCEIVPVPGVQIIAINIDDPLAAQLNDIDDVDRLMPGAISAVRTYFRQVCDCVLHLRFQGRDSNSLPML